MVEEDILTEKQRKKFLAGLHRQLFWCGERIPDEVEIHGKMIPLHEITWELINKPDLNDEDKEQIEHCIVSLSKKARSFESVLETETMTVGEAKGIFDKTAGPLRAVMDLKEIEELPGPERMTKFKEDAMKCTVKDAKGWIKFLAELDE
ncbi:MAG: methyl-accepting chemotaxis protein [Methanococcoides sp.]|nr:methyl-accepting chemotaxis protein [Methanococcoides sp.]